MSGSKPDALANLANGLVSRLRRAGEWRISAVRRARHERLVAPPLRIERSSHGLTVRPHTDVRLVELIFGATGRDRTADIRLIETALYHLSYRCKKWRDMGGLNSRHADRQSAALPSELMQQYLERDVGFEPTTNSLEG